MEVTHRTPVEADAIRSEFDRARQAAVDGDSISASTLNFIVFIDDRDHRDWVVERALKIADKHPSRLLLLDATAEHDDAFVVTASTEEGGSMVLTERVEIPVGKLEPARMGSLVMALTRPDVPSVLWWTAPHVTTDPRFGPLADVVSNVLVDSSGTVRDGITLVGLERFWERHNRTCLVDLAWMRLSPWRDMIAGSFDGPNIRKELFSLRRLRVVSGTDAEAYYIAGWLASRLGWQVAGPRKFTDRNGLPVDFVVERSGEMRRVTTVELDSLATQYSATLTEDPTVVALKADGEYVRPATLATLSKIDNASLIERAILEPSADEIFETSLRIAAQLLA